MLTDERLSRMRENASITDPELVALLDEYAALKARAAELERECAQLSRWIVSRDDDRADWACALCRPHSDMLIEGFVCARHRALAIVRANSGCDRECPYPGPHKGPQCRVRKGFRYASDEWCDCKCHHEHDARAAFARDKQDHDRVLRDIDEPTGEDPANAK